MRADLVNSRAATDAPPARSPGSDATVTLESARACAPATTDDPISQLANACAAASAWPLPGAGSTAERWRRLAELAERDLVLARLVEAHADAIAILHELGGGPPTAGERWGVWAAEVPSERLECSRGESTSVDGQKAWCSGATLLTRALVTAWDGADRVLCAVDLTDSGVVPGPAAWAWEGMRAADTRTMTFRTVPADVVGDADAYVSRPGFWVGGIGVAACWFGGAVGLAAPLRGHVARHPDDAHAAAHLGAVAVTLGAARDVLRGAAATVDADAAGEHRALAFRVRSTVADAASTVAARVGRALGPAPYVSDPAHARRVADLEVYVRQDHAERDLAALGHDVGASGGDWQL